MSERCAKTKWLAAVAAAVLSVALMSCGASYAEGGRSTTLIRKFQETHECPATHQKAVKGKPDTYKCEGFVVDHAVPYCAGQYLGYNFDVMANLSYQSYADSLKKDDFERKLCATLKKNRVELLKSEKNDGTS